MRTRVPDVVLVSVGGVIGSLARFGVGELLPHAAGQWAWSTWSVNTSGCLLIGVLIAWIEHAAPRFARPLLGVGVLGGYTTFSTAMVDALEQPPTAAVRYLATTLMVALAAVAAGWLLTARFLPPAGETDPRADLEAAP